MIWKCKTKVKTSHTTTFPWSIMLWQEPWWCQENIGSNHKAKLKPCHMGLASSQDESHESCLCYEVWDWSLLFQEVTSPLPSTLPPLFTHTAIIPEWECFLCHTWSRLVSASVPPTAAPLGDYGQMWMLQVHFFLFGHCVYHSPQCWHGFSSSTPPPPNYGGVSPPLTGIDAWQDRNRAGRISHQCQQAPLC